MLKKLLKNSFILAIILLIIQYLIIFLLSFILFDVLKIKPFNLATGALVGAAIIVGEIYSRIFREVPNKILLIKVASIVTVLGLVSLAIISMEAGFKLLDFQEPVFYLFIASIILGLILTFFLTFWLVGLGGKLYMKKFKRKN